MDEDNDNAMVSKVVTPQHIIKIISCWTGIPVTKLSQTDQEQLLHLGGAALVKAFPTLVLQLYTLPEVWWYVDDEASMTNAMDSCVQCKDVGFYEPEVMLIKQFSELVDVLRARLEQ
eukprot:15342534-Ditylum_brightwellii.AAC.1